MPGAEQRMASEQAAGAPQACREECGSESDEAAGWQSERGAFVCGAEPCASFALKVEEVVVVVVVRRSSSAATSTGVGAGSDSSSGSGTTSTGESCQYHVAQRVLAVLRVQQTYWCLVLVVVPIGVQV